MKKIIAALTAVFALATIATIALPTGAKAVTAQAKPCTQQTFRKGSYNQKCVEYIQQMLNAHKIANPELDEDGDFGPLTKTAVVAWQNKAKIKADGLVGKQTWKTLCDQKVKYAQTAIDAGCDKQLSSTPCAKRSFSTNTNASDPCVGHIQTMLNLASGAQLTVGNFNIKTKAAVMVYQDDNKLSSDGIVGPKTWAKLCKPITGQTQAIRDLYKTTARQAGCKV